MQKLCTESQSETLLNFGKQSKTAIVYKKLLYTRNCFKNEIF